MTKRCSGSSFCYSRISGRGIYKSVSHKNFTWDNGTGQTADSDVLMNILSGEQYYMRKVNHRAELEYYQHLIHNPADRRCVVWPSDIITNVPDLKSNLYTEYSYCEKTEDPSDAGIRYALLFPLNTPLCKLTCDRILPELGELSWKNQKIVRFARSLLRSVAILNDGGYLYFDYHFRKLLTDSAECRRVMLDYSNLIYPIDTAAETFAQWKCRAESTEFPVEFAHPEIVRNPAARWDICKQNYSLAAMLFYLFIGRYAYDGPMMEGYSDDTLQNHYIKFRDYHKMPVFIFDENNTANALGVFADEAALILLWQELPEEIRRAFSSALCIDRYDSEAALARLTPLKWLELIKKYNLAEV